MLTERHRNARLQYATTMKDTDPKDYIYTDELKVRYDTETRRGLVFGYDKRSTAIRVKDKRTKPGLMVNLCIYKDQIVWSYVWFKQSPTSRTIQEERNVTHDMFYNDILLPLDYLVGKHVGSETTLIMDNASIHKKCVSSGLFDRLANIRVGDPYLPSVSPDLNPVEQVNRYVYVCMYRVFFFNDSLNEVGFSPS